MNRLFPFCALLLLVTSGCDDTTGTGNDPHPPVTGSSGVYILCEGLRGQDNSVLARYDDSTGAMLNNFFRRVNPGLRIGDTATDMLLVGDTCLVVVSESETIEYFRTTNGKWLGRIHLPSGWWPRYLVRSGHTAYVSVLNRDKVLAIDLRDMSIVGNSEIEVGPAPEQLDVHGDWLYVANSGYGNIRAHENGAGTLSLVSLREQREAERLYVGPNTVAVLALPQREKLYAAFLHLPTETWPRNDSLGGIVEFDLRTHTRLRTWRLPVVAYDLRVSLHGNALYVLTLEGIESIDLNVPPEHARTTVFANKHTNITMLYGFGLHPRDSTLWIANARDFVSPGEVIVANLDGNVLQRFEVGLNPTAFTFFPHTH